ncbi:MAG: 4Fe-4S binding protein [Bacteroidales bacterium]|nr:4Fe-4S binding protein [Bacteroidales bacterium]
MLKKIRIALATLFFIGITLMFLDFTGAAHAWLSWMAKLQFLPAVLGLNIGVIVLVLALTLAFGRIYCSVICPAGVFQDIVAHIAGRFKKNRYTFSKEKKILRLSVLGVFVALVLCGCTAIAAVIAPYSAYGRIAQNLFQPVYMWINNCFASIAEHYDSYSFYTVDVWIKSCPVFALAVVTLLVFTVLAFKNGRTWCNTVCPVGTVLGYVAKFSFFKIQIDEQQCVNCNMCSKNCKAACIDVENHEVDSTRCVSCMTCIGKCKKGAIKFALARKSEQSETEPDKGLRAMLTTGVVLAASQVVSAQEKKVDGGLAVIEDKKIPERETPLKPAGSKSVKSFSTSCTGCQLCVAACPNGVLRPSSDLSTFLQPEMSFERGFCRPECTRCSEVCPAGAINLITKEEKTSIRIGHAVWVKQNCIAVSDGVNCGSCAKHCPSGAITMVPMEEGSSVMIPALNSARCIGCGACEYYCPSRPLSAIYVEGNDVHGDM